MLRSPVVGEITCCVAYTYMRHVAFYAFDSDMCVTYNVYIYNVYMCVTYVYMQCVYAFNILH